ncbi:MAG: GNAT family N-acetyltransferase [Erysipelotrichaceae bacterium]|nr:GNAT family N-acetyltransferase [Erysipelotrichaceae bacterium]
MKMRYEDVIIRDAEEKDVESLYRWWNDGRVMAHAGFPKGLGISKEKIRTLLEKDDEDLRHLMITVLDTPIGECYYRKSGDAFEIGIKICEESYQEKGIGKTVLSLLCREVFKRTKKICLSTDKKNSRARHVYEQLGFRLQEIKEKYYQNDQMEEAMDVAFYELKREDFRSFVKDFFLVKPDLYYADSIRRYRKEYIEKGMHPDGSGNLLRFEDPEKWIADNRLFEDESMLILPMKPSYQYAYVETSSQEIVGLIQVRPDMSDSPFLAEYGGNIGYSVLPSRWREGIGERMLKDFLVICQRDYHLEEVLITCLEKNEGSRRIILKNGGVFQRNTWLFSEDQNIERYIIDLREEL